MREELNKLAKAMRDMSDMVGDLHWMAAKAVEDLIKKDARIVELESQYQRDVWGLNNEGDPIGGDHAGGYANDNARMRSELAAIKAQEPVGSMEIQGTGFLCAPFPAPAWASGRQPAVGTKLYAAPVSVAKAQGVVQWPEADEIMQMAFEEGHPADDASGYYFELEEFDLFIERLMSEVARLNAAPVQQVSVPDGYVLVPYKLTPEMIAADPYGMGYGRIHAIYSAMLAAAPAAPAADAGLVAVEWAEDAEEWGPALNEAGWLFLSELNEDPQKSALIFNNTKGPLRAAIMKYAEIVAAHSAKGVM